MKSAEIRGEDNTNETAFLEGILHMFLFINFVVFKFLCPLLSYFRFFALPYYLSRIF